MTLKKSLLFSVIVLCCCTLLSAQARFVIAVSGLKLRSAADFGSSTMEIIPYGEQVWQISVQHNWKAPWAKVNWQGKTGYVYAPFLSNRQTEPRTAITEKQPARSLLVGTWYVYDPFCPEKDKFTGHPDANISFYSKYLFSSNGSYSERHYEGGAKGQYSLSGNRITIKGRIGYVEMGDYYAKWDVSFYQIRNDWLVMEIMNWISDKKAGENSLRVFFIIKPLSSQARQKVTDFFAQ